MNDFKKFLKIGLPCLGEQGLLIMTTTISSILVSRLGDSELIISNMTTTIINWMQAIFTGMALGVTVVMSNAYGEKNFPKLKKIFTNGIYLVCGIALLTMLITLVFSQPLVFLFYGKNLMGMAIGYFLFNMIAMPATAYMNTVSAAARGTGDSFTGLISVLVLNVINIFMIWLFCYQDMIAMPLDPLTSAGIAVIVSRYVSALFSYVWVKLRKSPILPKKGDFAFDKDILKNLCKVGVPTAIEYFIFRAALLVQQQIIIPLGDIVQGGYQIGMRVLDFASAFATAFQMTAVIMIAQALGGGEEKSVTKTKKILCNSAYIVFLLDAIFIFFAAPILASLFVSKSSTGAILESGIIFSRSIAICSFFFGCYMTYAGILRGAGDNTFITIVTNIATWGGRVLLSIILLQVGLSGHLALMLGLGADFLSRAIVYFIRLKQNKRQNTLQKTGKVAHESNT